eukprot:TRINITY_DN7929_c0_g4_i3.p5 TRINITY_DN7929_c0_g4~~TRINITY_DN7929_c0_g4_i3.p5  ORF type:complete len:188 (+),score=-2.74 TRINITY_DN7929_c0_g4_i3:36-566(+)
MWAGVPSEPLCLHTQSLATAQFSPDLFNITKYKNLFFSQNTFFFFLVNSNIFNNKHILILNIYKIYQPNHLTLSLSLPKNTQNKHTQNTMNVFVHTNEIKQNINKNKIFTKASIQSLINPMKSNSQLIQQQQQQHNDNNIQQVTRLQIYTCIFVCIIISMTNKFKVTNNVWSYNLC